jgi:PAS domain S-box-containing protein
MKLQVPSTREAAGKRDCPEALPMRYPPLGKAKILIVDDAEDVVEALRFILVQDGYREIASTTDATDAIRLFKAFEPDLVVLDLVMPGSDGLQVLKELRAIIPAETYLPILIVTSSSSARARREALALGASDFVAKPYDTIEIIGRIGNLLEMRFLHLEPLLESRRFLQNTFDALSSQIAVLDESGTIVEVNGAWSHFAAENGFAGDRCGVGSNYLQACDSVVTGSAADARAIAAGIRAVIAGQTQEFRLEYPFHTAHERRWFIVRVTRFSTNALRVVVAHENITERREAENYLQSSQTLLRMAGRLSRIGAWAVNLPELRLTWSDEVYAIHEHPAGSPPTVEEAVSYYAPEFRELITRNFDACVCEGTPFDMESQIETARGRRVWVRSLGEAVRDQEGNIIGVQGALQDISGQKETEEKIRQDARRLTNTLESITDAFVTIDRTWHFTYVNHEAERLYKRERSGLLGRPVWEEFKEAVGGTFDLELHRAMQENRTVSFEAYYAPLGKWLDVQAYPSDEGLTVYFRDVTEQRTSRTALLMSEERFRVLAKATNDAIWEWDLATGTVWWNEGLEKLLGFRHQEITLTVDTWMDHIHPDDQIRVRDGIHHAIELGRQAWTDTYRFICLDGREAYVLDRGHIIRDARGNALRMIGGMIDLTERKRVEEELRWQTAFLEAQVNSSIDGVLVVGPDGNKILQNQRMADLLGIPQFIIDDKVDETQLLWVMGQTKNPKEFLERVIHLQANQDEISRDELEFADGTLFDRYSAPVIGKDGTYYGRIWTFRDITERKQAEDELFRSRETLRGILDHIPQRVFWKDRDLIFRGCNRAFALDMGCDDPSEVIGKTDFEAPWGETAELPRADDESVMRHDRPKESFEEPTIGDDGRPGWLRTSKVPLHDRHGRVIGVLGTYEDVTAHKLAKQEIERLNAELEQRVAQRTQELFAATEEAHRANRAKSEFLSRTSHELRTPLNAIVGFGQLLEAGENLSPESRESITQILAAGRHLLTLINEVLDISGAESGNIALSLELVAVDRLLEETVSLVQPLGTALQVKLKLAIPPVQDWHVLADAQRLKQVLLNLLSNAIKYNRPAGWVTVECAPVQAADPPTLRFTVRDSGPGIGPENIGRLFMPFDRLDAERTKSQTVGTGLGLALSKRMVELMGGHIGVESVPGEGSTFWFDLPLADKPVATIVRAPVPVIMDPEIAGRKSKTVLYIKDSVSNLRFITRILARRPAIRLLSAATAADGLEVAYEHRPDLILLDLHLPGCNAAEVLAQLQRDPRTCAIPLVVVSGDASPEKRDQILASGARAFLTKPLEVRSFLRVLDQFIGLPAMKNIS